MGSLIKKLLTFSSYASVNRTLSLAFLLLTATIIPLTVYVANQEQDLRQRAYGGATKEECEVGGDRWIQNAFSPQGYCAPPLEPVPTASECTQKCYENPGSQECKNCRCQENPIWCENNECTGKSGQEYDDCICNNNPQIVGCQDTQPSTSTPTPRATAAPTPQASGGQQCPNSESRYTCTYSVSENTCYGGTGTTGHNSAGCSYICGPVSCPQSSPQRPNPTNSPSQTPSPTPTTQESTDSCINLPLLNKKICACDIFPWLTQCGGTGSKDPQPKGSPTPTARPTPSDGQACSYPQTCFVDDKVGVTVCKGKYQSGICKFADDLAPECTPCNTNLPTPTPPQRPTATPTPGRGNSNPTTRPNQPAPTAQTRTSPTPQPTTRITTTPAAATRALGKTCRIDQATISVVNGRNNVQVQFSATGNTAQPQEARLWVHRVNGQQITGIPDEYFEREYNQTYYYFLGKCMTSQNQPCTQSLNLTLLSGEYYLHCDLPESPNRCSGNPRCDYNGGSLACSSGADVWKSCSVLDHRTIDTSRLGDAPLPNGAGAGAFGISSFDCNTVSCVTPQAK